MQSGGWKNGSSCGRLDTNIGGDYMNVAKFKRRFRMVSLTLLCLLLCGCQALFPGEHTELVVDGEYKPFNVPRTTMEKLMELVEAEDVDYIYEVFSPAVRENVEGLYEQIQEFIRFVEENVTAWDFSSGTGKGDRRSGVVTMTRASFYTFNTDSGIYRCDIGDVLKSTVQPDLIGFSDITVYPEELSWEYAPKKPSGIYIVYRVGDQPSDCSIEPTALETLMDFSQTGNIDGIYEMFSLTAKRNAKGLQEKSAELSSFLSEQVISWEPYTWTQNIEDFNHSAATTQEMFFYLHIDDGLYRCDIREVLESTNQADVGISSISIFPALYAGVEPEYEDEAYKETCTWGHKNMGIAVNQ